MNILVFFLQITTIFLTEPPVYLIYPAIYHTSVNDVSPLRHRVWSTKPLIRGKTRLRTCVKVIILNICYRRLSAYFRRDLTDLTCQSHSQILDEDNIQNRSFLWLIFSQVV